MNEEPRDIGPLDLREGEVAAASWRLGDARPEGEARELALELNHLVHDAAVEHYGPMRACRWSYYTAGESEQGRAEFLAEIAGMGGDAAAVARGAAEWDGSERPIAVVHVGTIEARSPARREQARWN